ncbi:MAG TPA: AtpZ/AtpI family protein [Acidimicrobiales bacterium]|nr:AtpZ/AtpI family protein [Acidimicrobiales bacterium]
MPSDKRDLYNGFGDSLARAFEVVFTPFLFGLFGWWIDGRVGTRPLFALTLGILVLIYTLWKLSAGYLTQMDAETRKVLHRD